MSMSSEFRALHANPDKPLLLANVWDAGGARLVESLGAKAIAITSAGVAWSLGYADGNHLPVAELVRLAVLNKDYMAHARLQQLFTSSR